MRSTTVAARRADARITGSVLVASLLTHEAAPLHVVVATLFPLAVGRHLWGRRRWVRGVLRRVRTGLPRRLALDGAYALLLAILTVLVTLTGALAVVRGGDAGGSGHGELALLLTVACAVHALRHRSRRGRPTRGPRPRGPEEAPSGDAAPAVPHATAGGAAIDGGASPPTSR